jgi:hypothetical protein
MDPYFTLLFRHSVKAGKQRGLEAKKNGARRIDVGSKLE